MSNNQLEFKFPTRLIIIFGILLGAVLFFSKATITIGPGQAGVLYKTFGGGVVIG